MGALSFPNLVAFLSYIQKVQLSGLYYKVEITSFTDACFSASCRIVPQRNIVANNQAAIVRVYYKDGAVTLDSGFSIDYFFELCQEALAAAEAYDLQFLDDEAFLQCI